MQVWLQDLLPLIQEKNLKEMNMDELARLGGKSKSTLYEYFVSKEEILSMAVRGVLFQLAQYKLSGKEDAKSLEADYTHLVEWIAGHVQHISFSLLAQLKADFPEIWKEVEQFLQVLLDDLKELYERGIRWGYFKDYSVSLLLAMDKFFMMEWITSQKKNQNHAVSLEQMIHQYVEIRFHGILSSSHT